MTKGKGMPKPTPLLALPLLLAVAACGPEPHERPGTWRSSGVNDANLRAMVADPSHLERGVAPTTPARGETAASAAALLGGAPRGGGGSPGGAQMGGGGGGGGASMSGANRIPALPQPQGANVRN